MHVTNSTWLRAAGALVGLALATAPAVGDVLERSFDVGAQGTLDLRSDVGSIDVRSHEENRVDVRVP